MTRTRVVTALLLFLFLLWTLFWAPAWVFTGFIALVLAFGAWEWGRLSGLPSPRSAALFATALLCLLLLDQYAYKQGLNTPLFWMLVAAAWWVFVTLRLWRFQAGPASAVGRIGGLLAGMLTLLPLAILALILYQHNPFWLLWCMLMVMAADIAAYFVGRRWGRARLAPLISPGKTWVGFWGGLLASVLVGLAGVWFMAPGWQTLWAAMALGLVTALLGTLGDLSESMLKRQAGCKDSGALLPGHGGVLDRIDSLTAALPVFALGLELLQWL